MGNRINNQKKYWNRMAEGYTNRYHLSSKNAIRKIARKVHLLQSDADLQFERILEIGCGTGIYTRGLAFFDLFTDVTGVDLSLNMLEIAKRDNHAENITYQWDDAHNLTFPDASFDAVVGCYILQYLDLKKAIAEISRVLVPGGRIAFIDINTLNPVAFAKTKIPLVKKILGISKEAVSFTSAELHDWFKCYGFEDIEVSTFEFGNRPLNFLEKVPFLRYFAGNILIIAKKSLG